MIEKIAIKDAYFRILGWIETDTSTGVQTCKDFYYKIVGKYYPKENVTKDFYGRVVGHGNILSSLLPPIK